MSESDRVVISEGWMWRCFACGLFDGTWQDQEMCETAAERHRQNCEAAA